MTKQTLACLLILVAIATASHAQAPTPYLFKRLFILPPPEFDHPYPGKLILKKVDTLAEIAVYCRGAVGVGNHRLSIARSINAAST